MAAKLAIGPVQLVVLTMAIVGRTQPTLTKNLNVPLLIARPEIPCLKARGAVNV
jgi:hypothetical protein